MRNDVPSNEGLRKIGHLMMTMDLFYKKILSIYPVNLLPFIQQSIYIFPIVVFVVFSDYLKTRIYI